MKKLLPTLIVAIAFLSGCATTQISNQDLYALPVESVASHFNQSRDHGASRDQLQAIAKVLVAKGVPESEIEMARKGTIRVGMSVPGLIASRGQPLRKNSTVTAAATSIQHVYKNWDGKYQFIYTENGYITAWQKSES